jgi:uncharacterized membrane protein YeaQ/YmgE (transglycosylase-associated protein family)
MLLNIILFVVIGAAAGWLAGVIFKGGGFGFWINAVVGIIGGFVGGWIFGVLKFSFGGVFGPFITAVLGAILLLWILSLFRKK